MIGRYRYLVRYPQVFRALTGLTVAEFDALVVDVLPRLAEADIQRLMRPTRQRAVGGGSSFRLEARDQVLALVVWLRVYVTHEVIGYLFGISDSTVSRLIARVLPVLDASGRATMRMPQAGQRSRRQLDDLLRDLPELAVVIDSFEQRVQRPRDQAEADTYYSGKKKQHTLKSQVAVNVQTGELVDVSDSVRGPTADIALLTQSGLLGRLPDGVGSMGDLAYIGIATLHPAGLGAAPRRKPRGKARPADDRAYNTAFSARRIIVEHSIGRMRRYQCLTQLDRHHRRQHAARTAAVAGLVNRQLRHRFGLVA